MTTDIELATSFDKFVLTVDLMAKYLVDGFLLVQDLYAGNSWGHTDQSQYFQNYSVHVGNNIDYRQNPSCPGAPFMRIEKYGSESGWVYDGKANLNGQGLVWRYGTERPCNLVGRYVTIVADYSAIAKPFEIALCQFGVMGNRIPIPGEPEEL